MNKICTFLCKYIFHKAENLKILKFAHYISTIVFKDKFYYLFCLFDSGLDYSCLWLWAKFFKGPLVKIFFDSHISQSIQKSNFLMNVIREFKFSCVEVLT